MNNPTSYLLAQLQHSFPVNLETKNSEVLVREIHCTDKTAPPARRRLARELTTVIDRTLGHHYNSHAHVLYGRITRSTSWQDHKLYELQEPGICHVIYRPAIMPSSPVACFISLLICDDPYKPGDLALYILEIHVTSSFQNQRFGSTLLSATQNAAHKLMHQIPSLRCLQLTVFTDNRRARGLYTRNNFVVLSSQDIPAPLTVMYCSL
ncbi:HGL062Cp [Eremothecium sinecaudum]|uniref:HGL062Cp n=1 Tax=Eremothecium sinecaudum TaxID=45286 RepID=A0A109V0Q7_9SACH|nr:HGL062Cp [Eremothecium sinecaudum]AMD22278.1 HGL062Cp [Eremothecium sinecaudum]